MYLVICLWFDNAGILSEELPTNALDKDFQNKWHLLLEDTCHNS